MIVDAHVHFWDPTRGDDILIVQRQAAMRQRFYPADLLPLLQAHGVQRCVVMQSAPHETETLHLMTLTAQLPWVHGVVGWADLEAPALSERLRALQAAGPLLGLRVMLHRLADARWITRPTVARGMRKLAAAGLSLDLIVEPPHLEPVREALLQVPELRAIVNHGATPPIHSGMLQPWADGIATLARDTTAWCKFSGLREVAGPHTGTATLLPYARQLVQCFGTHRLLFASNWPCCDLAGGYAAWWDSFQDLMTRLKVGAADRDAILGINALQAYRLPTPATNRH
jgi:L-fuconolactonase